MDIQVVVAVVVIVVTMVVKILVPNVGIVVVRYAVRALLKDVAVIYYFLARILDLGALFGILLVYLSD